VRAGRLRHQVTLQKPVTNQDTYGQDVATWTDVATVWAGVEPLKGREFYDAQQVNAELSVRVVIRYRSDVAATWRVKHGDRAYAIQQPPIDPDMRHRELQLMCSELPA